MIVELDDGSSLPNWDDCPEVAEWTEDGVSWRDCRISREGMHERRLMAKHNGRHVLIQYGYSSLGTSSGPALERMTQSIRIHAI